MLWFLVRGRLGLGLGLDLALTYVVIAIVTRENVIHHQAYSWPCFNELCLNIHVILKLNPIPIGLFRGLESMGGGGGLIWPPPPQISATNGPIDSKIGTVVKQVK